MSKIIACIMGRKPAAARDPNTAATHNDVVGVKLRLLEEERQVPDDHVQIAIAPMSVRAQIRSKDRSESRLVLGNKARPFVKHEAHCLDDDGGVANR